MLWIFWIMCGSLLAGLGVGMGAFGAHALKSKMLSEHLAVFETAVKYQMFHALALLFLGLYALRFDHPVVQLGAGSILVGAILFSGSLYLIILAGQRQLGIVTPIGGLFLLLGWMLVFASTILLWMRS
jgi:uncharacterized membrane protein YgdD (TMEM256/DUF423 family)